MAIFTVKSSGGDYGSIQAAITANTGGSHTANVDGGFDAGKFTITGSDSTWVVQAADGHQHDGTGYDAAKARVMVGNAETGAIVQKASTIRGLQIVSNHATASTGVSITGTSVVVDKCFIRATGGNTFTVGGILQTLGSATITRNGVFGAVYIGISLTGDSTNPSATWLNNSVMLATGQQTAFSLIGNPGDGCTLTKAVNNVGFAPSGSNDVQKSGAAATISAASNNADNDGTWTSAYGSTSNQTSLVAADQFVDSSTGNLRLKAGNSLAGNGVSVSGDGITTDIVGTTMPNPPSIGWAEAAAPDIDVQGPGAVSITNGDTTPTSGDGTDFGDATGTNPTSTIFTVVNSGSASLTLDGTPKVAISGTNSGDFTVTSQPSGSISAAGSSPFTIQFLPLGLGARTATVSIDNNVSGEDPFTYSIAGNGLPGGFDMSDSERTQLQYVVESTYGVQPTTPTMQRLRITSESLEQTTQSKKSEEIRGDRQIAANRRMSVGVAGQIGFEASYGAYDDLWAAGLQGAWDSAVTVISAATSVSVANSSSKFITSATWTANPTVGQWIEVSGCSNAANNGYWRVLAVSNTEITVSGPNTLVDEAATAAITIVRGAECQNGTTASSYTFERNFSDITSGNKPFHQFDGVMVNQMGISFAAGEYIKGSLTVIGQQQTVSTATIAGSSTAAPEDEVMSAAEDIVAVLSNGVVLEVTKVEVNLNNQLRTRPVVGSVLTTSIGSGSIDLTGSLTVYFEDSTLVESHLNYTDLSMGIIMEDVDGNVYILDICRANLQSGKSNANGKDQDVMTDGSFVAIKDTLANKTLRMVRFPAA